MTRVKVCGVIEPAGALAAVELGAAYLGLNFFPGSPRFLELGRARDIADAVRGRVELEPALTSRAHGGQEEAGRARRRALSRRRP